MYELLAKFIKGRSGATAIEYSLIAALIFLALVAAARNFGAELNNTYNTIETASRNAHSG